MDLMDKFKGGLGGSKSNAEGTGSPEPTASKSEPVKTSVPKVEAEHKNDDLIGKAGSSKPDSKAASAGDADPKGEPSGSPTVEDPSDWTKESAFKEVKRLREENKAYRVKYEEKIEKLKDDMESRIQAREQELKALVDAQKELEEIKAKEADKKRDLSEKLNHRETLIAEQKAKMEQIEKAYQDKLSKQEAELRKYQAKIEAEEEVSNQRLNKELETIPEKFKEIAKLIVKGAEDSRDALIALTEAKLQGLFEDKTVVVNHSVPGAKDGARATKERLDDAAREVSNKMSPEQKVAAALKDIRSGNPNSAFRLNR